MIKLQEFIYDIYDKADDLTIWHVAKSILNYPSFLVEPVITKSMTIPSINCSYCKHEQEISDNKRMFCRRHLMLYEIKKFYITDFPLYFTYKDLIIFPHKYSLKFFDNVVIGAFTSKRITIENNELFYMLKFSFLKTQLPLINNPEIYDITSLYDEDEIEVCINNITFSFIKENDAFKVKI